MAEIDGILGSLEKQRLQIEEDLKRYQREHTSAEEILQKLQELRDRADALKQQPRK